MRLLLISAGVVLLTVMVLFMTRLWGLGQAYQAFNHPFLEAPTPWMAVQVSDLDTAKSVEAKKKDVIFWLNLVMTSDQHFLVADPSLGALIKPEVLKEKFVGPKTYYYDLKTLKATIGELPLLEEFLKTFPQTRKILVVNENANNVHNALIDVIDKYKAESTVMFQSNTEIILKSIKDKKPLWLFGTTQSDVMRLLTFESIGLAPASPFYGDVFVSPFEVLNRPAFNQDVLDEVRRRKKAVLIGPLKNADEIDRAKSYQPDGYIYETPELFGQELDLGLAQ